MSLTAMQLATTIMKITGTNVPQNIRFDDRLNTNKKTRLFTELRTAHNAPDLPMELPTPAHVLAWFNSRALNSVDAASFCVRTSLNNFLATKVALAA